MYMPKFNLHYHKSKNIDITTFGRGYLKHSDDVPEYNPFCISKQQNYNPIYNELFILSPSNYDKICLNSKYRIVDLTTVEDIITNEQFSKNVYVKYAPLLDPSNYMIGKYETTSPNLISLPTIENVNEINNKLTCYHNCAYIDNFFYYLSSQLLNNHSFCHGVDYYGSNLIMQDLFKVDITDELEYLQESKLFYSNENHIFKLSSGGQETMVKYLNPNVLFGTYSNKRHIIINRDSSDNVILDNGDL